MTPRELAHIEVVELLRSPAAKEFARKHLAKDETFEISRWLENELARKIRLENRRHGSENVSAISTHDSK